jgi:hypothetical protein
MPTKLDVAGVEKASALVKELLSPTQETPKVLEIFWK